MRLNFDNQYIGRYVGFILFILAPSLSFCSTYSACFAPSSVQQLQAEINSANLIWNDFTSPDDFLRYEYSFNLITEDAVLSVFDTSFTKSTSIVNLLPGKTYEIRLRTVCLSGTTNWSTESYFYTDINPELPCNLNLLIPDNSCSDPFMHEVSYNLGDNILGNDLFIRDVRFTIDHDWPADLELTLIAPDGTSVFLLGDMGIGSVHIGNIDEPCTDPFILDMSACESVENHVGALVGRLRPSGSFGDFYNGSSANGDWQLMFCDDASGQIGRIKYFELNFIEENCDAPEDIFFSNILSNSIDIIIPEAGCDSLEISYSADGSGTFVQLYIPCTADTITLDNINASTAYTFLYSAMCSGDVFSESCPKYFETRCTEPSVYESFDEIPSCVVDCDTVCTFSNIWKNMSAYPWRTGSGETNTDMTGPQKDFFGNGQYLYVESSIVCSTEPAILQSSCLQLGTDNLCHVSFSYHMFGSNIDSLDVQMSLDNGNQWFTIWQKVGDQGNKWHDSVIQLEVEEEKPFLLRFIAPSPSGNRADIALDEIVLSGIEPTIEDAITWYRDEDNDGYGSSIDSIFYCSDIVPFGYTNIKGDCDDMNELINPAAIESPCNLIDENCDGDINDAIQSDISFEIDSISHQTCVGDANGYIGLEITGGVEPYAIIWNDNQTGKDRSGLDGGFYFAVIEDQSGCQIITDSVEIIIEPTFDFLISSVNNATCNGIDNGSIEIFHDEDSAPFSYLWSNGSTTKNIESLPTGEYQLSITDINNCEIISNTLVVQAENVISLAIDSVSTLACNGDSTGFIQVSNDSLDLSYTWENNVISATRSDLSAGIYTVIGTDTNQCFGSLNIEILEPDSIEIEILVNEFISCNGENTGIIEVAANGGSPDYNYSWNTTETDSRIQQITAGNYTVTVTDSNNCKDSLLVVSFEADSIAIEILEIAGQICSNPIGKISLATTGGIGSYSYQWSDGEHHGPQADSLTAASYSVTVIDEASCKNSIENMGVPIEIIELDNTITILDDLICHGDESGSLLFVIQGVTSLPLQLHVNDSIYSIMDDEFFIDNLSGGNYDVEIIDGNGCSSMSESIIINQPDSIAITIDSLANIACNEDNSGFIGLSVTGGTGNVSFEWNTGNIMSMISNVAEGTYSVSVTDENGCIDSLTNITITNTAAISLEQLILAEPLCHNDSTGFIQLELLGGTAPYNIFINDSLYELENLPSLPAGDYTLQVNDSLGCEGIDTIVNLENPPLISYTEITTSSICGNANGSIMLTGQGGTGLLTFAWNDEDVENVAFADSLFAGTYSVTITDENECNDSIVNIELLNIDRDITIEIVLVDSTSCFNSSDGLIALQVIGDEVNYPVTLYANGADVLEYSGNDPIITGLSSDTYQILVRDQDGCIDSLDGIEIESPIAMTYESTITQNILCHGDSTGIISLEVAGGAGGFVYLWESGEDENPLDSLSEGYYRCAIIDNNNCILITDSIYIAQPDSFFIEAQTVDATNGNNNGAIYVQSYGGILPYTYLWDPSLPMTVDTIETLGPSSWSLTIVDGNGCEIDTFFVIDDIVNSNNIESFGVNIFPNPASQNLFITLPNSNEVGISIFSINGKNQESEYDQQGNTVIIPLNRYQSGIYIIALEAAGKKYYNRFVVEQ